MKICLDSIGCRLNQSEIETYAWQCRAAGHTLVAHPSEADIAIINTCTVTAAAASDTRQKIRQAHRAGVEQIYLTGCWSTLNPGEAAAMPGVCQVVPNSNKDRLVINYLGYQPALFEGHPMPRTTIPGSRSRTRAFIKVQDGCDNHCTYCITTLARGASRSLPIAEVIKDIKRVTGYGSFGTTTPDDSADYFIPAQEIVLSGVHLGAWGHDLQPKQELSQLVMAILQETEVPRVRLSSLEPWDIDEHFFTLWDNPRLCRQLHLPLQSGCAAVLRRMARKTNPKEYADLVSSARQLIPDVAITTDVIVGFPGESEAEFSESLEFVREMQFARGHVFSYSARPGTVAADMPDQVPYAVRKARSARMRAALRQAEIAYQQQYIGRLMPVLWEACSGRTAKGWSMHGLTDNYLRISATLADDRSNQISAVRLEALNGQGLQGTE